MAATRNSSSTGGVSGSRSSTSASGGMTASARPATSSSSSSMRSASTCTWVFSSATLTVRPLAVGRLQVEGAVPWLAHGAGDEPARTIEEMDLTGHAPRLRGRARWPADGAARSGGRAGSAADDGVRGRLPSPALLRRRRDQRGDVAAGVVDADDEGPGLGVGDHRDRRRVDDDPLELVQVQAQRVGEDRLDDVAVAAGQPDGVGAERRRSTRGRRRRRGPGSAPAPPPRARGRPRPTGAAARPSRAAP